MADFPPDTNPQEDAGKPPGTPRWVMVFGIIAIIVVLLIAFVLFSGLGGPHGPQRHAPSGDAGGHTPPITAS
jgi:ABC-type transporter Mla subunit MlaD